MENAKKRKCNNEVMKLNATFTLLIFYFNRETARFYQRLVFDILFLHLLVDKEKDHVQLNLNSC